MTRTAEGFLLTTVAAPDKLQWYLDAALVAGTFLVGRWFSKRPGSESRGYMTLQISRNGTYMCGHDYAMVNDEGKAHFGVLLLGRTEQLLAEAYAAMTAAHRDMVYLDQEVNFPPNDKVPQLK